MRRKKPGFAEVIDLLYQTNCSVQIHDENFTVVDEYYDDNYDENEFHSVEANFSFRHRRLKHWCFDTSP